MFVNGTQTDRATLSLPNSGFDFPFTAEETGKLTEDTSALTKEVRGRFLVLPHALQHVK